jgi:hypothetical protein
VEKIKACKQKLNELKKYENIIKKNIKIDTPFPNEIASFGCTLRCRLLLMLRNTTDVFRKTMNFDVWQMVDRSRTK